jgi:hypothetical protein
MDGCTNHSKLSAVAQVFTIKSDHELSEAGYDKIIEWARSIFPKGNRLKENLYAPKSMMKPLGLGYQKIDMCPNICMLYYLENAELTECMTCGHSRYEPRTGRGKTLRHIKHLDTLQSHLDCRDYSCHQGLLNTWHGTNHMMRLMEWWCILLTAKYGNILTVCILTFQLNQGMCVLSCVQMDSTYLGHLLLLILVGRSYSRFITYY